VITLDTNIYVSALQYGGMPMELLQRALNGDVEIAISQAILDETLRVPGQKFDWSVDDLSAGRNLILSFARMVEPQQAIHVITEDPTDNRIL
jgi:putative PIN family toxin of toxin-antitoxin system